MFSILKRPFEQRPRTCGLTLLALGLLLFLAAIAVAKSSPHPNPETAFGILALTFYAGLAGLFGVCYIVLGAKYARWTAEWALWRQGKIKLRPHQLVYRTCLSLALLIVGGVAGFCMFRLALRLA